MSSQSRPSYNFLGNCESAYSFHGKDHWNLAKALFHRCRVLIIQGPMFMGKTRLAEEIAKYVDKLVNETASSYNMSIYSYIARCGMIKRFCSGSITAELLKKDILSNLKKSHGGESPESLKNLCNFFNSRFQGSKESFLFILDELDCMPEEEVSKMLDCVCDITLGCSNVYFLLTSSVSIECPRISEHIHVHWCKQMKHNDASELLKEVAGDVDGLLQCRDSLVERLLRVPFYLMVAGQKMRSSADIRYTPYELLGLTDDSLLLLLDSKNVPTKDAVGERHAELMRSMPPSLTNMFSRMCEGLDLKRTFRASEVNKLAPELKSYEVKRGVLQELRGICLVSRDPSNQNSDDVYDITLKSLEEFYNTQFVSVNVSNDEFIQRIFKTTNDTLSQVLKDRDIRTAFSLWKYEKSCLFAAQKNLEEQQLSRGPEMKHALRLQLIQAARAFLHNCILDCSVQDEFRTECFKVLTEIESKESRVSAKKMIYSPNGNHFTDENYVNEKLEHQLGQLHVSHPTDTSLESSSSVVSPAQFKTGVSSGEPQPNFFPYHPAKEVESYQQKSPGTWLQSSPSMETNKRDTQSTSSSNQARASYSSLSSCDEIYPQSHMLAVNDLGAKLLYTDNAKDKLYQSVSEMNTFQSKEMPAGIFSTSYEGNSRSEVFEGGDGGRYRPVSSPHVVFIQQHKGNNQGMLSTPGMVVPDGYHIAQQDQRNAFHRFKGVHENHASPENHYVKREVQSPQPKRPETLAIKPNTLYSTSMPPIMPFNNYTFSIPSHQQNMVHPSPYQSFPTVNGHLPSPQIYYPPRNQDYPAHQVLPMGSFVHRLPQNGGVVNGMNGIQYSTVPNGAVVGQVSQMTGPVLYSQTQARLNGAYHQDSIRHFVPQTGEIPYQTVNVVQSVPQRYNHPQPYYHQPGLNNANLSTQSAIPTNYHGQFRVAPVSTGVPRAPSHVNVPSQQIQHLVQPATPRYQYGANHHMSGKYRPPVLMPTSRVQGPYLHHQAAPGQTPGIIRGWSPTHIDQSLIYQKSSLRTPPPQVYLPPANATNVHMYNQNPNGNGYIQ